MYSCTKEKSEKLEQGSNANASTSNDNYVVYESQQAFENHINYYISLSTEEKGQFKDSLISLGIIPLSTTLNDTDDTWLGLENFTAILNKDKLIQIGDSLIKIDKVGNVAYILSPVDLEYLPDLKNNQVVDGYVHLHDNLEQPIFEEPAEEGEGFGKAGLFCREKWANQQDQLTYSWDNHWQVYMAPPGTVGVKWRIRYTAAGIYFVVAVRYASIQRKLDGNIEESGSQNIFQHAYEFDWRRRCRSDEYILNLNQLGFGSLPHGTDKMYEATRALRRYTFKYWGRHTNNNGIFFNAYLWPMEIHSNPQ
jgi:hypothetical protein